MLDLAKIYRIINLYSHHAHNMTKGQSFFEDHAFFGELYDIADGFYDDVIERYVGTTDSSVNLVTILTDSLEVIGKLDDNYLRNCLVLLEEAVKEVEMIGKDTKISIGTQNLIQGHADKIETLIYKIKRRMA